MKRGLTAQARTLIRKETIMQKSIQKRTQGQKRIGNAVAGFVTQPGVTRGEIGRAAEATSRRNRLSKGKKKMG